MLEPETAQAEVTLRTYSDALQREPRSPCTCALRSLGMAPRVAHAHSPWTD